jgi:hypothetical protein
MLWCPGDDVSAKIDELACKTIRGSRGRRKDVFHREVREQFRAGLRMQWATLLLPWVREALNDRSIQVVAEQCDVSAGQLSRWENDGQLSLDMLIFILLRLDWDWKDLPPLKGPDTLEAARRRGYREAMAYVRWCDNGRPDGPRAMRLSPTGEEVELLGVMTQANAWLVHRKQCLSDVERGRRFLRVRTMVTACTDRPIGCVTDDLMKRVQTDWAMEYKMVEVCVPQVGGGQL